MPAVCRTRGLLAEGGSKDPVIRDGIWGLDSGIWQILAKSVWCCPNQLGVAPMTVLLISKPRISSEKHIFVASVKKNHQNSFAHVAEHVLRRKDGVPTQIAEICQKRLVLEHFCLKSADICNLARLASHMYNILNYIFDFGVLPEVFWASEGENDQKREINCPEVIRESFGCCKVSFGEVYHYSLHPTWKCWL